jgi:hypothetical protein
MGKLKNTIQLNPTLLAVIQKSGLSIEQYANLYNTSVIPTTMTTFNPNKDPVYSIPLSELVNLWRARYGDTWVDVSELEEDFWVDASARLHQNKMMEEINHHSDTTPWSRLKEDA